MNIPPDPLDPRPPIPFEIMLNARRILPHPGETVHDAVAFWYAWPDGVRRIFMFERKRFVVGWVSYWAWTFDGVEVWG